MQAMAKITTSVAVVSVSPTASITQRQHDAATRAAISSGMIFLLHRAHSNFWMRSPNRPRGRNSSTSTISRYIEASLAAGSK